ncbi:hypothetical protein BDQ12DRAFT_735618 [Crucibulum laeve]|uniref:Uncharacterized protein n=1 Tax=Crucibulum laeve TaxID=68775 RepID=A0A5C3M2Y5_9AGAR|nr:hypothetical protein BDQ12DRAFT_735618 [Crucibulum laeve]
MRSSPVATACNDLFQPTKSMITELSTSVVTTMTSSKAPPHKRRRIVRSSSPSSTTNSSGMNDSLTTNVFTSPHNAPAKPSSSRIPTCVSCHRALTGTQIQVICARCQHSTCTICSRTCTSIAPSQPPTPHLTWSPTPSPSPPSSMSRPALALNAANTNLGNWMGGSNTLPTAIAGKRKKLLDPDADLGENGTANSGDGGEFFATTTSDGVEPGCGRIVCRNCCVENPQSNSIACFDCCAR